MRLQFTSILLGLSLASPVAAQCAGQGQWIGAAPLALARQECAAARIGGRVYVAGGLIAGFGETGTVESYDIAANTWRGEPAMPMALHHLGLVAAGGRLWAVGGFRGGFTPRADVFVFDPGTGMWSSGLSLPQPRGAHWAVAHQNKIYCFGGVVTGAGAGTTSSAIVLDLSAATPTWASIAPMPTAREHLSAVAVGAYIYVIGGRAGGSFSSFERYHPASNTWLGQPALPAMPTARAAPGVAAIGPRIYVAGGETPQLFSVHEVFDIRTNRWSCATSMPLPRHGIGAEVIGPGPGVGGPAARILFPAGGTVQGLQPTAAADVFAPLAVCVGDYNGDGSATVQDIFDYLAAYFGQAPGADTDVSGSIAVQDLFDFLTAYFAGC
mgnify:CR=1 FL=1